MSELVASEYPATVVAHATDLLSRGAVREAIEVLTTANRAARHRDLERALVRVRQEGCAACPPPTAPVGRAPIVADPDGGTLVEVAAADLTAETVRMGFARSGCVLVRGLVGPDRTAELVAGIEATYAAFDGSMAAEPYDHDWFTPFPMPDVISPAGAGAAVVTSPGAPLAKRIRRGVHRRVTRDGAGIWTVDSPRMLFEIFELVDEVGVGAVISEFLGERPFLSANKCNVRRVPPEEMDGGWHQDGAFLGNDIGSLNCWIALTRCGRDAPGLDIVPRRFDRIVESGGTGAYFKWSLSDQDVLAAAEGVPIVRPEFEAGDALLFDHRLVHRTGTSPEMTQPRHAIEAWFFSPSAFPPSQLPLVY